MIALPIDIANALLNYLVTRPYQEVAGLISELQRAQTIEFEKSPAKDPVKEANNV